MELSKLLKKEPISACYLYLLFIKRSFQKLHKTQNCTTDVEKLKKLMLSFWGYLIRIRIWSSLHPERSSRLYINIKLRKSC